MMPSKERLSIDCNSLNAIAGVLRHLKMDLTAEVLISIQGDLNKVIKEMEDEEDDLH